MIKICAIVATAENNVIGKGNALPWHLPEDLKFFKKATMGKPMIMGRKCYESIGKPLPGRPNIVVSRSATALTQNAPTQDFKKLESADIPAGTAKINSGPFLYASIDEGIAAAKQMAAELGVEEVFITGGGEIYKQTMDKIDRLYLTQIHKTYDGDTFFPQLNPHEWRTVSKDRHDGDPAFTFFVLERKQ